MITSSGATLSVKASGTGPVVFLLHGFPLDHRMWLPLIETLRGQYHCIALDLRGFGGSTLDGDYSLADLAEDIECIRARLAQNQQINLVGLSMGGYVALEYWHRYGQHLNSLTLANTKPSADDPAGSAARLEMAQSAISQGAWSAVSPMLSRLLPAKTLETNIGDCVREMMRAASSDAVAAAQRAMARRREFTELIPSVRTPTLVITGELDPIAPPDATRQWSAAIPNCIYREISTSGHLTPLEKPNEFRTILTGFLNGLSA